MFEWLEWNPQRLQNPQVIVGLIIIVMGIILLAISKMIGNKLATKFNYDEEKMYFILKMSSFMVVVVGCIVAVTI